MESKIISLEAALGNTSISKTQRKNRVSTKSPEPNQPATRAVPHKRGKGTWLRAVLGQWKPPVSHQTDGSHWAAAKLALHTHVLVNAKATTKAATPTSLDRNDTMKRLAANEAEFSDLLQKIHNTMELAAQDVEVAEEAGKAEEENLRRATTINTLRPLQKLERDYVAHNEHDDSKPAGLGGGKDTWGLSTTGPTEKDIYLRSQVQSNLRNYELKEERRKSA